ncbi:hypothetical protein PENANT_c097G09887 [Penicillium antarcticum]|uniref:Uncharacterized protein n=1 Tax=Penicillium antarcticum TaxID=416450 RepID=A0A1V6PLX7_9EURO|nr:uncharacterized protein N7508_011222 [Penicillium antarcticum]XP_058318003.1 uncharacterized protein N7508_007537 [Penicillium antarcticum]KAJ5288447.1 hypothetical protein N7508_011222 [Penicillium antarcticum]KAJ5300294.1 hypothetical protein N7508_007537 [Penicillium antarcticum]OQD78018.1 hypothetical protein PENANT_c097G09887 [Penicillium antarcticum]
MDISLALEVLRNAPPEALQNHRQEAIEAFRDIEARLNELDFPESDSSIPAFTAIANGSGSHEAGRAASTQLPSSVEQPTLTVQDKSKPSHSMNLLTTLNKTASWVWKSTKRRPNEVLGIKRPRFCDRRIADVRRIEGSSQAEPKYKLLRVLAQRSLVLQGEKAGYLDVENYCKVASSRGKDKAKRGRGGTIAEYVREELEIEKEDQVLAIQAISGGIKQLVTERLLRERLEETGQYGSASGISAFTALAVRPFRYLKHEEIPEFLDRLLESDSMNLSALVDEPRMEHSLPVSIKEVIQKSSEWLDEMQVYYNTLLDIRDDFDEQQLNERTRKRPKSSVDGLATRSTESQSFSDRLSVIEPSSPDSDETQSHPPNSPQKSPDSFNRVLEQPGSNFSESPSSIGLESSLLQDRLESSNSSRLGGISNPDHEQTSAGMINMVDVQDMMQPILPIPAQVCRLPSNGDPPQAGVAPVINVPEMAQAVSSQGEQQQMQTTGMVNIYDMVQPILPQICTSLGEQQQMQTTGMVNVYDMVQPILPQTYISLGEQQQMQTTGMVNAYDMIQQILPAQNLESFENTNIVNIYDMLQQIPPAQASALAEEQCRSETNMTRFHDICQPISTAGFVHPSNTQLHYPFQSTPAVERQNPIIHGPLAMQLEKHNHNMATPHSPIILPVSAV